MARKKDRRQRGSSQQQQQQQQQQRSAAASAAPVAKPHPSEAELDARGEVTAGGAPLSSMPLKPTRCILPPNFDPGFLEQIASPRTVKPMRWLQHWQWYSFALVAGLTGPGMLVQSFGTMVLALGVAFHFLLTWNVEVMILVCESFLEVALRLAVLSSGCGALCGVLDWDHR